MKTVKGALCLIVCLAMLATGISGCSQGEDSSSPSANAGSEVSKGNDSALSIHYLSARSPSEGTVHALQEIADEYKADHPNFNYEVESIADRSSYLQKLKILASSEELPEWFDSDADSFYAGLVEKGVTADIEALYNELGVSDKFFKVAKDYQRLPNGYLGLISWQGNTEYFWYHKPSFEKAGIKTPPKTFDELFEACEKLKAAGITPIAMAGGDTWPLLRYAAFVPFRIAGNDFIEKARVGEESFGSEAGLAAANFVQKIEPYFQTGWSTADSATAVSLVASGQAGMIYDGTWQLPNFVGDDKELKPEFGYFPLPILSESDKTSSSDYWAHSGIGMAVHKDAMTDAMKDYFKTVFNKYADICLYDYNTVPSIQPTIRDELPKIYKELISNFSNVNTYAYCWDVRIDSASNEVLGRETPNLALGSITPEEWAKRLDDAVKQNVS